MSKKPQHNPETILPYESGESKNVQVRRMFDAIAPVYDRMNRLMTFGLDRGWRKTALKMLRTYRPHTILDVATGTGDLPFMMQRLLDGRRLPASTSPTVCWLLPPQMSGVGAGRYRDF